MLRTTPLTAATYASDVPKSVRTVRICPGMRGR